MAVSAPYEESEKPELVVETHEHSVEGCVEQILGYLEAQGMLPPTDTL